MGSNCCKGDAAGKPVVRSNSSIYTRSRAGATLDDRFKTSVDAGGVRLTVSAARTGDSGVYTLQASNAAGKDSTRVTLEVSPDEMPTGDDPPTFLRRLQDLTVKVGTRTRFLVEIVSSTECKVTWYRNERRLLEAERIALVRDGNFWCADVATVSADDAGRWTCTAENLGGRASCSAHLNVLVPKAYKRPEFVEELRAILTEQGTVSLECKVVGVPTPVLRWFKDSCEIKAGDVFALTANADDPTSLGTYTCEAVNCMGRAYSSSKVHVIGRTKEGSTPSPGGVTPDPPPIFTKELEDQFVRICDPLNLSCHIVVPPWPRSVVWYNKEGKIEGSMKYHIQEDGVGGYLLEVSGAEWADEGEWKCVATSAGGRVGISTCNVTMDVPKNYRKPRFMENLQAVLTEEGLVSFECKVVGFPTPVLSWFKDGQELKPGDVYQLTGTNSLGSYCCIAKNCMGQASSSAELTVEDIQNQLNEEEKLQLFSKNQAPKFLQGLKSVEVKIDEPFRFTIKVAIPPEPTVLWYRDDQPVDESPRCHLGKEDRGVFYLDIKNLELMDQTEWKCVAMNDFGHSVTSCFLKLIIPRHFKKPRFLENLQAILSDEGAVNLECKVIGVPQPVLKWYKDGEELKPGDIHRIISGQDGTCCLGTYTCEAQNCMGIAASSASLLGFEDTVKAKNKKKVEEQTLQRNLSLSTIHEERTSQMYDTPVGDITLDDKGEISFSFDGKEVSVSLYETPDLTEEEALQIVEMYADQLSENVTEHNVVELPPLRFVKETSTSGNLLMEAIIIDVSPDYFVAPEEDLRTEADIEDISIAEENGHAQLSFDQEVGEDYLEKTMAMLSEEKSDIPARVPRRKSDSQKSADDYFSLSKDPSLSEEKKDDDTQILSESASFASARSAEKIKSSKPSQDDEIATQPSSDVTKTVMLREEHRINVPSEDIPESKVSIDNTLHITTDGVSEPEKPIQLKIDPQRLEKLKHDVTLMSSILSRIMNNIQVTERDIILKSQLMSTAAIATKSLEIINSLITPLNEIHSITDAIKESIVESAEINNNLFKKLPDCLKDFQKSLTMVEKCVDVGNDKTFIKNTCISVIQKCEEDITEFTAKIKAVAEEDLTFMDDKFVSDISSSTGEILNVIKIAKSTIASKSIFDEAPKKGEMSVDIQHLNDTQKAIYDLKIPLNSLLNIVENALKSIVINSIDINNAEVILINMSASIQDLQTALEHIELLSVEESNSTLHKYNTNIIETVMGSVLKLRSSFESLSMEKEKRDDREELKNDLQLIKENLNEISAQVEQIENKIGSFDILHGDNKLDVLQKMAHILITLENSLPSLNLLPNVQSTMTLFHKYLTKALENVIESNETSKYLTLVRICDAVNRINASIKNIETGKFLSLASIGNNFSIIEDIVKNNNLNADLNNEIILIVNQYFNDIQNIITYTEDDNVRIDFESAKDISNNSSHVESKAVIAVHQIEQAIAVIHKVVPEEATTNINTIYPVLESMCPILEDLKYSIASLRVSEQEHNSHLSEMSEQEKIEIFGKPLRDLHENITILNTLLLETTEDSKAKSEITAVVAEPLHELHNTLQILQENVISQYESLSSLHANVDVASTAQVLENCFLIVQEQHDVEPVEEISTLEDISGIKTTAESISSDHLILPTENITNVEIASETRPQSEVFKVLNVVHETLDELEGSEVIKVLETLSEMNEFASLRNVPESILQFNREIQTLLPCDTQEDSISNLKLDSLTTISQTLDNCLSVIENHDILNYQDILQITPDKIQLVSNSLSDLKNNLAKFKNLIEHSPNKGLEVSMNTDCLKKLGEDYKMCIKDPAKLNLVEDIFVDDLKVLENSVDNFLIATNTPDSFKNYNNIKVVSEKLYEDILKIQDELIFYTVQPLKTTNQDNEILNIVNELANNLNVMQPYVTDTTHIFDIDCDLFQQCDILKEPNSLKDVEDVIKISIETFKDTIKQSPISSDLKKVEALFENCKSNFSILRYLLNQPPSQKKVIRLLHEHSVLQTDIREFKNIKNNLNLPQDTQTCLDNFLVQTEKSMHKIKTSLIKILVSLSKTLFKKPLRNIEETLEYLSRYPIEICPNELHEVIQTYYNILNNAHTHLINLEINVLQEMQEESFSYKEDKGGDMLIKSLTNFLDLLEMKKATTSNEDTKMILNKMLICIRKHQDYKTATGTGKDMILLKCLSDCSTILMNQLIEDESNKLVTKLTDNDSLQKALCQFMQPLETLHLELNKLKDIKLSKLEVQTIPAETLNSSVQTINQLCQAIDEYVISENLVYGDEELAKKIDLKLFLIQEIVQTLQGTHDLAYLSDVSTVIENTKESINKLFSDKKTGIEHKVPKEKAEALLQHMEQYIEITEIIEEISAIINVSDVKEAKKIAQELRESIASSELIPDTATEQVGYHIVTEDQENLVQQLQKSLIEIQEQATESIDGLSGHNKDVKKQVIEVISQLQEDLNDIAIAQAPIELSNKEIDAEEPKLIENADSGSIQNREQKCSVKQHDDLAKVVDTEEIQSRNNELESNVPQNNQVIEQQPNTLVVKDSTECLENIKMQPDTELSELSEMLSFDSKIVTDDHKVIEVSTESTECKANIAIHQIEEAIIAINNIHFEEASIHYNEIFPAFDSIGPILEELKCNVASLQHNSQAGDSHTSDMSDFEVEQFFAEPLRKLNENISVLNQVLMDSVKNSVENMNEVAGVFAKPLQELHNTLEILQENVISQYESLSSLHEKVNIATTSQILQSCCLLVQEQQEIEAVEDISTLDDLSAMKTTADSITSDVLGVAEEALVMEKECLITEKVDKDDENKQLTHTSLMEQIDNEAHQVVTQETKSDIELFEKQDTEENNISELNNSPVNDQCKNIIKPICEPSTPDNILQNDTTTEENKECAKLEMESINTEDPNLIIKIPTEDTIDSIQHEVEVMINKEIDSAEIQHGIEQDSAVNLSTSHEIKLEKCTSVSEKNPEISEDISKNDVPKIDMTSEEILSEDQQSHDLEGKLKDENIITTDASSPTIISREMVSDNTNVKENNALEVSENEDVSLSKHEIDTIKQQLDEAEAFQPTAIKYEEVIENMEMLLTDLKQNVELSTISITDNVDVLQNILDEFQIEVIKLKSENNSEVNDALTETLNDLECSVRSVQLQVSENSPPEHIMEASATLQLLVCTIKDVLQANESREIVEINEENILKGCVGETENTIILLDKVSETKKGEKDILNIIKGLNSIKETIKEIKQCFSVDEDTLIDKGVDILQNLETIENQLFAIENEINKVENVDVTTRDTIVTAVHSVYTSISNMRGTITSIQKRYIYQNYGKPSENILNAIKNINKLSKLDNKKNWIQVSKYLRKTLNHFEDVKFYINLDKTARLPSDATLTKIVLNELKMLITDIILSNVTELKIPLKNEINGVIIKVNEKIENIANQSILEVKDKIPIFKEISSQIFEISKRLKEFYESHFSHGIHAPFVSGNDVMLETEHKLKLLEILENEDERLVENIPKEAPAESLIRGSLNEGQLSESEGDQQLRENIEPLIDSLIDEAMDKAQCLDITKDSLETRAGSRSISFLDLIDHETEEINIETLDLYETRDEIADDIPPKSEDKELQEIVEKDTENGDSQLTAENQSLESVSNNQNNTSESTIQLVLEEEAHIIEENNNLPNDQQKINENIEIKQTVVDETNIITESSVRKSNELTKTLINLDKQEIGNGGDNVSIEHADVIVDDKGEQNKNEAKTITDQLLGKDSKSVDEEMDASMYTDIIVKTNSCETQENEINTLTEQKPEDLPSNDLQSLKVALESQEKNLLIPIQSPTVEEMSSKQCAEVTLNEEIVDADTRIKDNTEYSVTDDETQHSTLLNNSQKNEEVSIINMNLNKQDHKYADDEFDHTDEQTLNDLNLGNQLEINNKTDTTEKTETNLIEEKQGSVTKDEIVVELDVEKGNKVFTTHSKDEEDTKKEHSSLSSSLAHEENEQQKEETNLDHSILQEDSENQNLKQSLQSQLTNEKESDDGSLCSEISGIHTSKILTETTAETKSDEILNEVNQNEVSFESEIQDTNHDLKQVEKNEETNTKDRTIFLQTELSETKQLTQKEQANNALEKPCEVNDKNNDSIEEPHTKDHPLDISDITPKTVSPDTQSAFGETLQADISKQDKDKLVITDETDTVSKSKDKENIRLQVQKSDDETLKVASSDDNNNAGYQLSSPLEKTLKYDKLEQDTDKAEKATDTDSILTATSNENENIAELQVHKSKDDSLKVDDKMSQVKDKTEKSNDTDDSLSATNKEKENIVLSQGHKSKDESIKAELSIENNKAPDKLSHVEDTLRDDKLKQVKNKPENPNETDDGLSTTIKEKVNMAELPGHKSEDESIKAESSIENNKAPDQDLSQIDDTLRDDKLKQDKDKFEKTNETDDGLSTSNKEKENIVLSQVHKSEDESMKAELSIENNKAPDQELSHVEDTLRDDKLKQDKNKSKKANETDDGLSTTNKEKENMAELPVHESEDESIKAESSIENNKTPDQELSQIEDTLRDDKLKQDKDKSEKTNETDDGLSTTNKEKVNMAELPVHKSEDESIKAESSIKNNKAPGQELSQIEDTLRDDQLKQDKDKSEKTKETNDGLSTTNKEKVNMAELPVHKSEDESIKAESSIENNKAPDQELCHIEDTLRDDESEKPKETDNGLLTTNTENVNIAESQVHKSEGENLKVKSYVENNTTTVDVQSQKDLHQQDNSNKVLNKNGDQELSHLKGTITDHESQQEKDNIGKIDDLGDVSTVIYKGNEDLVAQQLHTTEGEPSKIVSQKDHSCVDNITVDALSQKDMQQLQNNYKTSDKTEDQELSSHSKENQITESDENKDNITFTGSSNEKQTMEEEIKEQSGDIHKTDDENKHTKKKSIDKRKGRRKKDETNEENSEDFIKKDSLDSTQGAETAEESIVASKILNDDVTITENLLKDAHISEKVESEAIETGFVSDSVMKDQKHLSKNNDEIVTENENQDLVIEKQNKMALDKVNQKPEIKEIQESVIEHTIDKNNGAKEQKGKDTVEGAESEIENHGKEKDDGKNKAKSEKKKSSLEKKEKQKKSKLKQKEVTSTIETQNNISDSKTDNNKAQIESDKDKNETFEQKDIQVNLNNTESSYEEKEREICGHSQRLDEIKQHVDKTTYDRSNERDKVQTSSIDKPLIRDKPQFVDPNIGDPSMEFSRPPSYMGKPYDSDANKLLPEVNTYSSTSKVFYKAQSLVRDHQLRSPSIIDTDTNTDTKDRSELRFKSKALSETRNVSEKRIGSPRDLKRKPVFSTHLTNRTAVEGSRVKLTCSVLSSTEPVLKWYKNGVPIDDKQKYKIKFADGLITMELLNAIPSDSGDYSCTVENEHGSVTTSAKLKVYPSFEPSPIPPTFTRSIRDIYHVAENELVLECRIRGQPLPTITWIKDNQPVGTDSRFEATYLADGLCRLTISNPTSEDSGTYTCKAESSMWTDQITHVVQFIDKESRISPHLSSVDKSRHIPDTRRPHFTNVLSDYKVVKGGTIGLQVEIGGAPTRVEWLREGSCVTELYRNAQTFVDHGIYTLALSDVTEKHSGLYTCRAWSTHGNVDMNADITVVQPSEVEGKPAVIVSRPAKDVLISIGEDINISFRVQGEPRPKVMFMKGIRDITNSQRVCKMTSDDYVKFTLKRSVISDAGTYCVLARNAYGCDRAFITVVVRQRASSDNLISDWTYPMDDQAIVASDRKYKSVPGRIPGEPSAVDGGNNWLTLAWPKPDPNTAAPVLAYRVDSWLLGKDGGARWVEMGITPRNTFDAFNLKQGEEYHFRVTPRNRYGWGEPVQTSAPVGVGLSGDRPEFIDILPGLLKVLVGETANLSCSFKGKPTPEIVWMKNGHEIEESSRLRSLQSGNICSLKIQDVNIEDEGRYSCEATNVHGRASTYARMTVITDRQIWEADAKLKRERSADAEGEYPPQFTMRLRDRRVQATYPVRLTCQVIGSPTPTVTWFKDGQEVVIDSRRVKYQDEHFHTLEIAPTTLDDGGVYEALARNGSGAISCRCSLVVDKGIRAYVAPEFCCGLEPSYRLNEGEELRISAIVEAYPSVGVTWYREGVRLRPSRRAVMTLNRDGQIELALASVTPRDAGVYTCTASNEVGQASTSGKVEIVTGERQDQRSLPTVICPDVPYSKEPMFLKKPRSTEAQEGDTVIIECEVIGDPTPDVYWLRDFLKPDYYRDANHFKQMAAGPVYRFEIPHAKLDYTGAYSVVARNVHGEAKAIISLQIFAKDLRSTDDTHNIRYGRVEVIPRFEKELTDLLCYDGDAVEFECRISGNPEPDIRWFHYNEVLPDCPDFESTFEVGTARLKIKQVAAEDEGTYTCEASNNLGKATSKACLVVYPPGEPNTLSQRLQRPPALSSAASTPRSTPRTTPARSMSRTPGPEVRRLRSPTREIAPKFYTYPFNKVVEEGETVVFQCAVGGLPPPWATWDKDGIIITPTSRISIKEKDEMLRILQIDEVTIEDVGLYRITLENDYGRAEASARLEVISHKRKFYGGTRSCSASPRRMMSYTRRTPSYSRQD
ncbi:uncharacterized protein LOC123705188 isoform X2 [Colias croceus]|uniref:uncharacterized protein LOC123705188 isoform X2 n=1 Tax=Colias crocea TaxID=72248 RepID=UPI001E280D9F|nr:uncharacterized protein LOC123705188 isoform X2 [Colias croceus]